MTKAWIIFEKVYIWQECSQTTQDLLQLNDEQTTLIKHGKKLKRYFIKKIIQMANEHTGQSFIIIHHQEILSSMMRHHTLHPWMTEKSPVIPKIRGLSNGLSTTANFGNIK